MKVHYPENFYTILPLTLKEFNENVNENKLKFSELITTNKHLDFEPNEINLILDLNYLNENFNIQGLQSFSRNPELVINETFNYLNLSEALKKIVVFPEFKNLISTDYNIEISTNLDDLNLEKPYVYVTQHITQNVLHLTSIKPFF